MKFLCSTNQLEIKNSSQVKDCSVRLLFYASISKQITKMEKVKVVLVDNDEDELFFMKNGFESTGLFTVMAHTSNMKNYLNFLTTPRNLCRTSLYQI